MDLYKDAYEQYETFSLYGTSQYGFDDFSGFFMCGCLSKNLAHRSEIIYLAGVELNNFPEQIFKQKKVTEINLGPSGFTSYGISAIPEKPNHIKTIPEKICRLKYLKKLDLSFNNLSNLPDLNCLDSLEILNLAFNEKLRIRENIDKVARLKSLKALVLLGTDFISDDTLILRKHYEKLNIVTTQAAFFEYLTSLSKN